MSEGAVINYGKYVLKSDVKFPTLKTINYDGSGSVDASLRGMYTSFQAAIDAIDSFNSRKSESDAKEKPATRSKSVREGADNGGEPVKLSA
jgi:hypothetical protein